MAHGIDCDELVRLHNERFRGAGFPNTLARVLSDATPLERHRVRRSMLITAARTMCRVWEPGKTLSDRSLATALEARMRELAAAPLGPIDVGTVDGALSAALLVHHQPVALVTLRRIASNVRAAL